MDLRNPRIPQDPLGEALHSLRMSGAFYCRSEFTEPWGLTLPPLSGHLWFHVVTSGRVSVDVGDGEPAHLQNGDVALVTQGAGHRLGSDSAAPAPGILDLPREEISDRYEVLHHGGGGALTRMMCGAVRFDHPAARNLVALLPEIIYLDAASTPDLIWMQSTLALIHGDPARAWTVATLADELAMSRSAFAARFTELVGEPVMAYVTRWRMRVAVNALRDEGATVAELAHRLGYRSEAAFARAFKRVTGVAPGAVKRAGDPVLRLA